MMQAYRKSTDYGGVALLLGASGDVDYSYAGVQETRLGNGNGRGSHTSPGYGLVNSDRQSYIILKQH